MSRYRAALAGLNPPGSGKCHTGMLGVANLGVKAGIDPQQICEDIRKALPVGSRKVPDQEIIDAVKKALADRGGFTPQKLAAPATLDGQAAIKRIISQGTIRNEDDIREISPIPIPENKRAALILFLKIRFRDGEHIFISNRMRSGIIGETICTREEWEHYLSHGTRPPPFIIINPLNGQPALTKSGHQPTLRGDANVTEYRHCLVEFDRLSKEDQFLFWSAAKLPIVALVDSGGKSIHAWLEVKKLATVSSPEQWQTEIKNRLYDQILTPMGVDGACSNPARLSRLPGHYRIEKERFQRLLWLSAEGRTIT